MTTHDDGAGGDGGDGDDGDNGVDATAVTSCDRPMTRTILSPLSLGRDRRRQHAAAAAVYDTPPLPHTRIHRLSATRLSISHEFGRQLRRASCLARRQAAAAAAAVGAPMRAGNSTLDFDDFTSSKLTLDDELYEFFVAAVK